ncbi:MAG: MerR family transcriptional regulator [Devosiaceae bacterium]|nr:MerR family transcriptional regulator [Devosiaceae bacterium]
MGKSAEAFRTISEAAGELDLPQHVLRFWETRFTQIKPLKRGGGRRYYRPEDVLLLKGIRHLLYDQGFTIKGVQRILKEESPRHVIAIGEAGSLEALEATHGASEGAKSVVRSSTSQTKAAQTALSPTAAEQRFTARQRNRLSRVMGELLECKRLLDNARE